MHSRMARKGEAVSNLERRVERLEAALGNADVPSWEEYWAAQKRVEARAKVEIDRFLIQFNGGMTFGGIPIEERPLPFADSESLQRQDQDTIGQYEAAHGLDYSAERASAREMLAQKLNTLARRKQEADNYVPTDAS
jgi:hypothetical protein